MRESLGFQLKKTKAIMDREYNKYLKPHGVSAEQGLLMKYIYDSPGCSQTEMADDLYKDKTTVTRMVDTLVKKNFVERQPDLNDRRSICLHLTPEGKEGVEKLEPLFTKHKERLEALITPEDAAATMRVLKTIEEYYKGLN